MRTGLHFLVAAKHCEIDELRHLALTTELVAVTARLVHALQRERGLTNLVLASQAQRFGAELSARVQENRVVESEWRASVQRLDLGEIGGGHGARLYSRLAYALQGLDALEALRERVRALDWTPAQATEALVRLIAALLAVVFEAADNASDPDISRHLVALFQFMQAKEFAGQERALGAARFATGRAEGGDQQRLLHLIESQERCLEVFNGFADEATRALWAESESGALTAGLEKLRRVLCTTPEGAALKPELSQVWFDACSERMDRMKHVEDQLSARLASTCEARMLSAQREAAAFEALLQAPSVPTDPLGFFAQEPPTPRAQPFGPQVERSILDLVQEQAQRLQTMAGELDTARASLNERKLIERAKGLLMAHRHLSEAEAHKTMRQMAMNQNRRLIDVAEAVLAMAEVLPERGR